MRQLHSQRPEVISAVAAMEKNYLAHQPACNSFYVLQFHHIRCWLQPQVGPWSEASCWQSVGSAVRWLSQFLLPAETISSKLMSEWVSEWVRKSGVYDRGTCFPPRPFKLRLADCFLEDSLWWRNARMRLTTRYVKAFAAVPVHRVHRVTFCPPHNIRSWE